MQARRYRDLKIASANRKRPAGLYAVLFGENSWARGASSLSGTIPIGSRKKGGRTDNIGTRDGAKAVQMTESPETKKID
jgi:hypothetical protein